VTGIEAMLARTSALYALHAYLPVSNLARLAQRLSRALRGKPASRQDTHLPQISWREALAERPVLLVETEKRFGNVNLAELAVLALAAAHVPPGSELIEIGTFDGRTAMNLAVNAPERATVVTLDLPAGQATAFPIEESERKLVDKPASGARLQSCPEALRGYAARVRQVYGDSASYDWTPHHGRAGLVFVDGSHAYDYAMKDSETAFRLTAPGGIVIWHDYGVWPGVTRALEDLERARKLGLRRIRGTSLVFWRALDRTTPTH
jgi:predicted O-methyltransferase YrrM